VLPMALISDWFSALAVASAEKECSLRQGWKVITVAVPWLVLVGEHVPSRLVQLVATLGGDARSWLMEITLFIHVPLPVPTISA
jgi:hypothetical protein